MDLLIMNDFEEAATLYYPRNFNTSEWIKRVLVDHFVPTFEVQQALETLGGFPKEYLRMLTRADLGVRTNKRVAEIIFEALDNPGEAAAETSRTSSTRTSSVDSTRSPEAPARSRCRGGRPKLSPSNATTGRRARARTRQDAPKGRLWQFLLRLLNDAQYSPAIIRWEDRDSGAFRFVHGRRVAEMWGKHKGNDGMDYNKMSRAIRTYKNGAFEPHPARLVYKFGQVASWAPEVGLRDGDSP